MCWFKLDLVHMFRQQPYALTMHSTLTKYNNSIQPISWQTLKKHHTQIQPCLSIYSNSISQTTLLNFIHTLFNNPRQTIQRKTHLANHKRALTRLHPSQNNKQRLQASYQHKKHKSMQHAAYAFSLRVQYNHFNHTCPNNSPRSCTRTTPNSHIHQSYTSFIQIKSQ